MKEITPWRVTVTVWALFLTLVLIFKVQEPEPIYIELPAPTPQVIYRTKTVKVGEEAYYADIANSITEDERELLAKATYLEAGNQSMTGQRAVVEVILNRVMSDGYPNTIEEVLYQPGEFSTAPYLDSAEPNEEQYEAIDLTLKASTPILDPNVLFFATSLPDWQIQYEQIGAHYFGYWGGIT